MKGVCLIMDVKFAFDTWIILLFWNQESVLNVQVHYEHKRMHVILF